MKLGIVGATGLVGRKILKVIDEYKFHDEEIYLAASNKSVGLKFEYNNHKHLIYSVEDLLDFHLDIILFCSKSEVALSYAYKFSEKGAFVIDNSSAFRNNDDHLLIVPEVNGHLITKHTHKIISNPNCSTIQLVMVLKALSELSKIKQVTVSTYQSVTGSGIKGISQLELESKNIIPKTPAYPYPIYNNCIPHCDDFLPNGFTKEEMKLINESQKILGTDLSINATAVRVPVKGGHSESVRIVFENEVDIKDIHTALSNFSGIIVLDNPKSNIYPMPIFADDKDEVFVGRIRKDIFDKTAISLWIVSDNLRKGAATNAMQIVKQIIKKKLI